jgi:lichenan operon transcriptional antiterminator
MSFPEFVKTDSKHSGNNTDERFLTPDLFMHNHTAPDAETLIRELAADSIAKGFANEGFVDEVLAREAMSPTSFGNRLALPHSMNASANRSFLSVVTNDQPMVWGSYEANLILLMGISPSDRKAFRMLFDSLTEVLSDAGNVMRLSRCTSFGSFAAQLNEMIRR